MGSAAMRHPQWVVPIELVRVLFSFLAAGMDFNHGVTPGLVFLRVTKDSTEHIRIEKKAGGGTSTGDRIAARDPTSSNWLASGKIWSLLQESEESACGQTITSF